MNEYIFIIAIIFMVYALTVIVLVGFLSKKDKMFDKERERFREERQDLLNRIMSKNTTEYINIKKQDKPTVVTDGDILGDDYFNGIVN